MIGKHHLVLCCLWSLALLPACSSLGDSPLERAALPLTVVTHQPVDDATGVPTDVVITVDFDDFPDPTRLTGYAFLNSNASNVPVTLLVDLLDKRLSLTPTEALAPNLQYTVQLFPGLSAIGTPRAALAAPFQWSFRTGDGPANAPRPDPPIFKDVFDNVLTQNIGAGRQGCNGDCHIAGSLTPEERPVDLGDEERAYKTLVGANETQLGMVKFLRPLSVEQPALQRVTPFVSGQSYLLRKLVGTRDVDNGRAVMQADGGIMLVRAHMEDEDRMPLPRAGLEKLRDWIDGGARTESCDAISAEYLTLMATAMPCPDPTMTCGGAEQRLTSLRCNCRRFVTAQKTELAALAAKFDGCPKHPAAMCTAMCP